LTTTNVIESPQTGVERRAHNFTRWRDADMVERWGRFGLAAHRKTFPAH